MRTKEKLVEFMQEQAYKPMLKEELVKIFDIERKEKKDFYKLLDNMEIDGYIVKNRSDRYGVPERMNAIVGKLQAHSKGFGFVIPDNKELNDVYVSSNDLKGALHGDRVIAQVSTRSLDSKKAEGEIIRIIERANETIVGTFENSRNFGFVVPDESRINMDIFIPKSEINGAKSNQKVVVKITKWPDKRRSPEGKVIEILGDVGDVGTDILAIIRKFGLPEEFSEKVLNIASDIPEEIPESEIKRRKDLREMTIFTIDGADAKDLDDAISVERLDNGQYRLGVHIADVTYYVKENSRLDKEALKRATSVYLIDRVIPMLPRKLSNGMCSLHPHVPRLTLSVFMDIDKKGNVVSHEIVESIIESKERMTYTDVSNILENDDAELKEKYKHVLEEFKLTEELASILRKRREKRGSIDFDFDESKIVLDENGKPIDIVKAERRTANRIIEECMLVCNETVAEFMYWSKTPFLYRVHEDPDLEKINNFNKFIYNFGYILKGTQEVHPKELQQLLKKVKGTKEETVINTLMLRSLKKARYSSDSQGHFGLAAKYYSHFTSPIRRYPDLQIHRIIKDFLGGKIDGKMIDRLKKRLPMVAEESSAKERTADEAEREVDDLKKVEYMVERVGQVYEGIISSVTSFGMFVELDNTIEGLVHVSTLVDDYYIYDESNYCFIGERTKKTYKIGEVVKIRVEKADISRREIDFILVDGDEEDEDDGVMS